MAAESAAELLTQRFSRPLAQRLVRQLERRTDGDLTLLAQLADQIDPDADGLQRVPLRWPAEHLARVRTSLDGLAMARPVLGAAAVVGREFDLSILERMLPGQELLDPLDAAHEAGVIRQFPGGVFGFASALAREVCYDELSARTRAELHERAAEALSSLGPLAGSRSVTVVELAYHLSEAATLGGARRLDAAIAASAAAGSAADAEADYQLAAALFAQAALLAGRAGWPPGQSGRLLAAAGVARRRSATTEVANRVGLASLTGALRLGRRASDPDLLAAAALGLGPRPTLGITGAFAAPDSERRAALTEALVARVSSSDHLGQAQAGAHTEALVAEIHAPARSDGRVAQVDAALAESVASCGERGDSTAVRLAARLALEAQAPVLAREALAAARTLADPRAMAEALLAAAHCGDQSPGLLNQAVREAAALADHELLARAYDAAAVSAFRRGGAAAALPELARLADLPGDTEAEPRVSALVRWYALRARATMARLTSDPDASSWAERALAAGRAVDPQAAQQGHDLLPAVPQTTLPELTNRERDVARLALRGTSTKDIAEALFLGERTVESHLGSIYRKLQIRTRIELITKFGDDSALL